MNEHPRSAAWSGTGGLFTGLRAMLANYIRRRIELRRRRLEEEREFYHDLDEYRRAHNMPLVDPNDWTSWAHQRIAHRERQPDPMHKQRGA